MRFQPSLLVFGIVVAASLAVSHYSQAAPAAKVRQTVHRATSTLTSRTQRFSIWLPAETDYMKEFTRPKKGEMGVTWVYGTEFQAVTYLVRVTPKRPYINISKPKRLLYAMQMEIVKASGATLQKREEIQLAGFPGREIKTNSGPGGKTIRARIYLTSQDSYQIWAAGSNDALQKQSAQIDKVLNSFRILPKEKFPILPTR